MRRTLRGLATAGAAVVGAVAALSADQIGFLGTRTYAIGTYLGDLGLADLDGDGALDVVVVRTGDQYACTVQWGDGDGAFGAPQLIAQGYSLELLTADMDGDGDLDVVRWGNTPEVVENLGGRAFAKRSVSPDIVYWKVAAAGDFDGDGDLDLAGIGQSSTFHFAENDVTGHFTAHLLPAPAFQAGQVHDWIDAGDVNGDGDPDLALVYRNTGTVRLLLGNGAGNFAETAPLAVGGNTTQVVVADLDGDGDDDVAAAGTRTSPPAATPNHVVAFRQESGGTLVPYLDQDLAARPVDLDGADVDGDGHIDLVATTTSFEVLLGDGQTFAAPVSFAPAAAMPVRGEAGDVDGDGRTDFANTSYNAVGILLQSSLPPPRPTTVTPSVLREPADVDVEIRGSGFGVGATVLAPAGLTVTSSARVSDDVMTARIAVPSRTGSGDRTLTLRNPDGKTSAATLTLQSLDVASAAGELRDRARGRHDRLHVTGTLAFNGLARAPGFAAPLHGLTVRAGDPQSPLEVTVPPADPRWRYVRGRQVWRSPGRASPRAEISVDGATGTYEVTLSHFAFQVLPGGDVRVEIEIAGPESSLDRGSDERTWTPGGRRHTFVLRP